MEGMGISFHDRFLGLLFFDLRIEKLKMMLSRLSCIILKNNLVSTF